MVGKIISMGLALGPIARFMTRELYALLHKRYAWCDRLELTAEAKFELQFWIESREDYNARPIRHSPSAMRVAFSDASNTRYGSYTVEHGMHIAQGNWSLEEARQNSTWRELVAVGRVLEAVATKLGNGRLRWFTDNQNIVRILTVGSGKGYLQAEAMRIFKLCICHHIHLEPEWIPREENELADYLSRIVELDDWLLNPMVFLMLDNVWGPHTVDRFASHFNTQLTCFNSRFACSQTEAVDAFTVDWSGENNWLCPPPGLIPGLGLGLWLGLGLG